jgi:F-type H+-transporting ATPase subunit delta
VSEILGEFLSQTDIRLGVCRAELITARPVSQAQASEFEVHLGKCLNKKTILSSRIDTTLKAGYIVKIGNTLIDASLKTKLSRLKDTLIQGV